MAVKTGPKRQRARAEEKAKAKAIEENRVRGRREATRKTGKLRSYKYKESDKKKPVARKLSLDPTAEGYSGRIARAWKPWEEAIIFAEPGQALNALGKHQMLCPHDALQADKPVAYIGEDYYYTCPDCQAIMRWWGSYTSTIRVEWMQLRLEGYSMPSWGELFTKDKSLWVFVLEEAHAALSDEEAQ